MRPVATTVDLTDATPPGDRPADDRWAQEQAWVYQAACRGRTELFFPPYAERPQARARREQRARAICAGCPVRDRCLWWGRQHHEYGIWGGENEEERVSAGYSLMAPVGARHLGTRLVAAALSGLDGPTPEELELEELEEAEG